MGLIEMEPRNDLSSTGYALANPGVDIWCSTEPDETFTMTLEPGTYASSGSVSTTATPRRRIT